MNKTKSKKFANAPSLVTVYMTPKEAALVLDVISFQDPRTRELARKISRAMTEQEDAPFVNAALKYLNRQNADIAVEETAQL